MTALTLLVLGCRPPQGEAPEALRLDRHPERLTTLTLPATSRPSPAPDVIPLPQPFAASTGLPGLLRDDEPGVWQTTLPLRHVWRGHSRQKAPPGMTLTGPDGVVPYSVAGEGWSIRKGMLQLRQAADSPPPDHTAYHFTHPAHTARENARNMAHAETTGAEFALRDVRLGDGSRHGVLLPAPATAAWEVPLYDAAVLDLSVALMRPLVASGVTSDGAALVVRLEHDGGSEELGRASLLPGDWRSLRLKLPRGLTGTGRIVMESLAAGESDLDYIFVAAPTLHRPAEKPRRVVLVFVDTLRPDHLGRYGYDRPTSPVIDAWAQDAVVFTEARSVAPWTLPSTRTALSGMQPEGWHDTASLPERLSQAGYTTAGIVANAFISAQLGMNRGFDHFTERHLGSAEEQVADALEFLADNDDRDVALMLHLMDPHLPYEEPEPYRSLWAGESLLPKRFGRNRLIKQPDDDPALHQYVVDRYDQNIRYTDEALKPLLAELGRDDVVVFFSDHGEEFWEHGEVEHGHALYDEVIKVPLMISGPGLSAATLDAPVSLLDITPTLLDLLGIEAEGLQGSSLVPLMHGEAGAAEALSQRVQGFGRTLYGRTLWGTLQGTTKRIRFRKSIEAFDIAADPGELAGTGAHPDAVQAGLTVALQREVPDVWRMETLGTNKRSLVPGELFVTHPAGFRDAWKAYDPHGWYADPVVIEGVVRVAPTDTRKMPSEVFLLPNDADPTGLLITHHDGDHRSASAVGAEEGVLQKLITNGGTVRIVEDFAPVPDEADREVLFPEALEEELRELGYLE